MPGEDPNLENGNKNEFSNANRFVISEEEIAMVEQHRKKSQFSKKTEWLAKPLEIASNFTIMGFKAGKTLLMVCGTIIIVGSGYKIWQIGTEIMRFIGNAQQYAPKVEVVDRDYSYIEKAIITEGMAQPAINFVYKDVEIYKVDNLATRTNFSIGKVRLESSDIFADKAAIRVSKRFNLQALGKTTPIVKINEEPNRVVLKISYPELFVRPDHGNVSETNPESVEQAPLTGLQYALRPQDKAAVDNSRKRDGDNAALDESLNRGREFYEKLQTENSNGNITSQFDFASEIIRVENSKRGIDKPVVIELITKDTKIKGYNGNTIFQPPAN